MTMVVMPECLGASVLVRTVARPYLLRCAPLVHTFWPLIVQPPSDLTALVLMPAASDPAPGSLKSWHQMTSWFKAGTTQRMTCSGVAYWIRVRITQLVIPYDGRLMPAALNSCSTTSCSTAPASRPHGFGQFGIT